jgi:hypothetical protein
MPPAIDVVAANYRLTEDQVRERLHLCESPEIVDELYTYGQTLAAENLERIRSIESKAVSFAAYGSAIVTILVSSSKSWAQLGNQWSPWLAFYAALCGLVCTCLCVSALSLRKYEVTSEDEWLEPECLSKTIYFLKRYRILTTWGLLDAYIAAQKQKAKKLQSAQVWLTGSVGYLSLILFQLALLHASGNTHWFEPWQRAVHYDLWSSWWKNLVCGAGTLGDRYGALLLGLPLLLVYRGSRSR